MGNVLSHLLSSLLSSLFVFLLIITTNFSFLLASSTSNPTTSQFGNENNGRNPNPPTPPSSPPPLPLQIKSRNPSPFRPSIGIIVGILTTVFSITFLLLLYAKHCRRGENSNTFFNNSLGLGYPPSAATAAAVSGRKNSGIDRAVIESLPIFRFSSLMGQKDGLECAVCLNKFEPSEVLRLLPKCKHAFHVECVDTWLDAHSTCPLCRYRVDPEDVLLVEDNRILYQNDSSRANSSMAQSPKELLSRVSGRHSFAGSSLEVISERRKSDSTTSFVGRRSLDSWNNSKKKRNNNNNNTEKIVAVGCFDHRPRKDGLLLAERRLEHRIIISGTTTTAEIESNNGPVNHRWSDVQPSDLLFLRSEMILSDSRRFLGASRGSRPSVNGGGKNEINGRSVSEITGLSRFRSNEQQYEYQQQRRQRQVGAVSRWLAWISQSQRYRHHRQPAVPPPPPSSLVVV